MTGFLGTGEIDQVNDGRFFARPTVLEDDLLEFNRDDSMCTTGCSVHLRGSNGTVALAFLHLLLDGGIAVYGVLG